MVLVYERIHGISSTRASLLSNPPVDPLDILLARVGAVRLDSQDGAGVAADILFAFWSWTRCRYAAIAAVRRVRQTRYGRQASGCPSPQEVQFEKRHRASAYARAEVPRNDSRMQALFRWRAL